MRGRTKKVYPNSGIGVELTHTEEYFPSAVASPGVKIVNPEIGGEEITAALPAEEYIPITSKQGNSTGLGSTDEKTVYVKTIQQSVDFPYDILRIQSSAFELRKSGVLFNENSDLGKQAKRDFEELLSKGYRIVHMAVENREFIFWWEKQ